jgi:hypothetical protein
VAHTWEETGRTPATATAAGSISYVCNICGGTKTETIAQTQAQYTITKTVVNVDGSETTTTETKTDEIGKYISLSASDYESEGLTVDLSKSLLTGEINAEGTLALTVYVDRVKATYTFMIGETLYDQNEYYYGSYVAAPLTPDASLY